MGVCQGSGPAWGQGKEAQIWGYARTAQPLPTGLEREHDRSVVSLCSLTGILHAELWGPWGRRSEGGVCVLCVLCVPV